MVCVSQNTMCDLIDCIYNHMYTLKYMCEYSNPR